MTGLAIAAFVVSIVSLLWNIGLAVVRWPRIGVVIRPTVTITMGEAGSATDTYQLVVLNQGAEAVTIANIGLRSEDRTLVFDYDNVARSANPVLPGGEALPTRIEGHGCLVWTFDEDLLAMFPHGTKVYGFADRYRTFRKRPARRMNPIRRTETIIPSHRNGGRRAISA